MNKLEPIWASIPCGERFQLSSAGRRGMAHLSPETQKRIFEGVKRIMSEDGKPFVVTLLSVK